MRRLAGVTALAVAATLTGTNVSWAGSAGRKNTAIAATALAVGAWSNGTGKAGRRTGRRAGREKGWAGAGSADGPAVVGDELHRLVQARAESDAQRIDGGAEEHGVHVCVDQCRCVCCLSATALRRHTSWPAGPEMPDQAPRPPACLALPVHSVGRAGHRATYATPPPPDSSDQTSARSTAPRRRSDRARSSSTPRCNACPTECPASSSLASTVRSTADKPRSPAPRTAG